MSETAMFYAFMKAARFAERLSMATAKDGRPSRSAAPHITLHKKLQYYFTTEETYSGESEYLIITVLFFTSDGEILFGQNVRTHWTRWTWVRQGEARRRLRRETMYRNIAYRHGIELADSDPFFPLEDGVTAVKVKFKANEIA